MYSDSNPIIDKIRYYFSFLIVGLYLIMGLLFLFSNIAIQIFPVYREAVGGVLIVYAGYRLYANIKRKRES